MYWRRLHAIDLTTGHEKNGSPSQILAASKVFPGQGVVNFEASQQLQRAGLTLASGAVYAAFGSHCGAAPYQVTLMSRIMSQRVRAHIISYGDRRCLGPTLASSAVYAAFGSHCGAAPYQVILMSRIMSQRVRAHTSWTHAGVRRCVCSVWGALWSCAVPGDSRVTHYTSAPACSYVLDPRWPQALCMRRSGRTVGLRHTR